MMRPCASQMELALQECHWKGQLSGYICIHHLSQNLRIDQDVSGSRMCFCTFTCLYQLLPYNLTDTKVENKTLTIQFVWTECWQYQRKNMKFGFLIDMNTEQQLWRKMGPSIGEEARALSLTDVVAEARNVGDVDEGLIMSKMGTELWLCQMVAMEHWLF